MPKIHRFYVGEDIKLKRDFWVHDQALIWQWNRVLRFKVGDVVGLFDYSRTDRLYKIKAISKTEAHLILVTEKQPNLPGKNIYLFWSLLKKDNNELILQKATELGVSNFVPIITQRTIKKDYNTERARKIVIEASEQCGRSDVPHVRDAVHLQKALEEYKDKITIYIAQHGHDQPESTDDKLGVLIGPEGGWTDDELEYFKKNNYPHLGLSEFTLRGETAAIVAVSKLL